MWQSRCRVDLLLWTVVYGFGAALAFPAGAQAPAPEGGQLQISAHAGNLSWGTPHHITSASNGDFVVVWRRSSLAIQAQRYASDGSPQGGQFQVNTYSALVQNSPTVAAAPDGSFIVVWQSGGSPETDTDSDSIQGRRFAADGSPRGSQFQINSHTTGYQSFPSISAASNGDFVVVWGSGEYLSHYLTIKGQRYDSSGSPQGSEFQVNTYTTDSQRYPSVSTASDGDFVVVWQTYASSGTDASNLSIQGQRYDSNGLPQGGEFQVNTYTTGYQKFPSVFSASNGDFIVVWQSEGSSSTDTSEESIQGQRYASDGSPQGGEFQINTDTTGAQKLPSVSSASNGDFVVVWAAYSSGSNQHSIQGQRYSVASPNLVPSLSPTGLLGLATVFAFVSVFALRRRGGNRSLT